MGGSGRVSTSRPRDGVLDVATTQPGMQFYSGKGSMEPHR